jgi:primosomal protein N'
LKISVSLSYNIFEPLTYQVAAGALEVRLGSRVLVPLGRRLALGWVVGLDSPYGGRLKGIIGIIDDPFCPDEGLLEFARQAGAAYFASAGSLLDHCLPPSQRSPKSLRLESGGRERKLSEFAAEELGKLAVSGPLRLFFKTASPAGVPAGAGTQAPPGAGTPRKSGIQPPALLLAPQREREYRDWCEEVVTGGGSVILVVPDNATAHYWQKAIPGIDPYHSGIKAASREKTWQKYRLGKHGIVCGGISALMLPLAKPGLLILDRAASSLYQRGLGTPFHVDQLAEIRAKTAGIPLARGGDSHSCATYAKREDAGLGDRRQQRGLSCQVHMLKAGKHGLPAEIVELIRGNYLAKKKTLVLVNRIQPSTLLFCESCRRIAACPRCGGALQVGDSRQASCRRCAYRKEDLAGCPRCGQSLAPLHDISIESLSVAVARVSGESEVLALTAAELKDPERAVAAVRAHPIVIATMAALNPFFAGLFASALWVKPESFFNMEEYNAAEMIHASGAEIAATLGAGGELHVFSVFHFHHALRTLMDEAAFFEREMKYRQWFMLPPFASVYELELRDASLRSLGAAMRMLSGKYRDDLQIKRIYLASRQPQRGAFRGILELHATAEKIAGAGLQRIKKSVLRRTAG